MSWYSSSDADIITEAAAAVDGRPIVRIWLRTVNDAQPDTAEVDFSQEPPTVRRYKTQAAA